jgi:hypothetical protein
MALINWNNLRRKSNLSEGIMPSRKRLCIAFFLTVILLTLSASADVPVEGMKQADYNYVISNIKDYPDYVFLTSSAIWGWSYASIINSTGDFGGGYKLDSFQLHAIKASDFERAKFFAARDQYNQEIANCTDYCRDNPKIVSSNLTLPKATSVNEILPLEKIEVDLRIDSITDQALKISKTKMLYYYENGTVQEFPPE